MIFANNSRNIYQIFRKKCLLNTPWKYILLNPTLSSNLSFRTTLMNDFNNINTAIASLNPNDLLRVILCGDESFNKETNCKILTASLKFRKDTKRFEKSIF